MGVIVGIRKRHICPIVFTQGQAANAFRRNDIARRAVAASGYRARYIRLCAGNRDIIHSYCNPRWRAAPWRGRDGIR